MIMKMIMLLNLSLFYTSLNYVVKLKSATEFLKSLHVKFALYNAE
jgi:hypothetical protein